MKLPPLLVVDDERNMRVSLESVLRSEGYDVRLAESAEAALALLRTDEVFMVITDARLGGMSGYEFLKEVKLKHPQLPVLMMTAYATPKLAVEAIKNGAIDYLGKPFEPDELLHAVARCGDRHELRVENAALKRRASDDPRAISVQVMGGEVTLAGTVHSWSERDLATHAVWSTPGVHKVVDHMTMSY